MKQIIHKTSDAIHTHSINDTWNAHNTNNTQCNIANYTHKVNNTKNANRTKNTHYTKNIQTRRIRNSTHI